MAPRWRLGRSRRTVSGESRRNGRLAFNEDAMATEKTAEGIRVFAADIVKLEQLIKSKRG